MVSEDGMGENKLVPMGNIVQNAQIEVVINKKSEFVRAEIIPKENSKTAIPCTIESSIRTSAPRPHLLYDNITYIAGDLKDYLSDTKDAEKSYTECYQPFISQLEKWTKSKNSNDTVDSIYGYLVKESVVTDLINAGLFEINDKSILLDNKIEGISPEKVLVRIAIEKDGELYKPWEDINFQKFSSDYYFGILNEEEKSLCYSSGKIAYITPVHGKYIRFPGDGSKLLSSNDNTNFTFRGRFETAEESAQISYEVSEKSHSALRWIIQKQGRINDGYTIVSWSDKDSQIPKALEDSEDFFGNVPTSNTIDKRQINTGSIYAEELKKAAAGYKSKLSQDEQVYTLALNNAGPGRMAILYYREIPGGEFVDRLQNWYKSISWQHSYKKDSETEKLYTFYGAAAPYDIIKASFGVQRGDFMEMDNKILNKQLERLLPCILDGKRIPIDFVMGAYRNGVNPVNKNLYNWKKSLSISCGLSKKYYKERTGEEIDMKLNEENNNRSYLFGRLLAVAYRVEEVYYFHNNINRMPTGLRLMDAMSKRPYKTWANINLRIIPYLQGMKTESRKFYINLIDDIMVKFQEGDFSRNRPLEPKFLMGFHAQHEELRKFVKEDVDTNENSIQEEN